MSNLRSASQVLANSTAIWGLPGYTFKGIYKELQKHLGSSVQNYIVAARTAQGYEDWHNSTQQERLDVVSRWQAIQVEIEKEKHLARHGSFHAPHCYLKATIEERKRQSAEKRKNKKIAHRNNVDQASTDIPASHPFVRQTAEGSSPDNADFEEAIQASVAATSRGNPDEDKMIEKAIRASVLELQMASREGDNTDAVQRAIQASVNEAARVRGENNARPLMASVDGTSDHDKELEAALHRSVQDHPAFHSQISVADIDFDDSGIDTDDDENIKAAIERSKSSETADPKTANQKDEDFQRASELSQEAHKELEKELYNSKSEEEIVLEYVKKQSLVEEKYKKSVASKQASDHDPDEQEIQEAMKKSLDIQGD